MSPSPVEMLKAAWYGLTGLTLHYHEPGVADSETPIQVLLEYEGNMYGSLSLPAAPAE